MELHCQPKRLDSDAVNVGRRLSENFFAKQWPQAELNGLVSREMQDGKKFVIPVWHKISSERIRFFSPTLADRFASDTSVGVTALVKQIEKSIASSPKNKLDKWLEFESPLGGKLSLSYRPNSSPSVNDADWESRAFKIFTLKEAERLVGLIETEIESTTLNKKK
jgi:hypothetical protein